MRAPARGTKGVSSRIALSRIFRTGIRPPGRICGTPRAHIFSLHQRKIPAITGTQSAISAVFPTTHWKANVRVFLQTGSCRSVSPSTQRGGGGALARHGNGEKRASALMFSFYRHNSPHKDTPVIPPAWADREILWEESLPGRGRACPTFKRRSA